MNTHIRLHTHTHSRTHTHTPYIVFMCVCSLPRHVCVLICFIGPMYHIMTDIGEFHEPGFLGTFLHSFCVDVSSPPISAILVGPFAWNTAVRFRDSPHGFRKSCAEICKAPGSQDVLPDTAGSLHCRLHHFVAGSLRCWFPDWQTSAQFAAHFIKRCT